MNRSARELAIALVAALLTLAALAVLALGTTLIVQLDIRLAANRQHLALARAEARTNMTALLLKIETESQGGELPHRAPSSRGLLLYRREDPAAAVVAVEGGSGSGRYRKDARVELRELESSWKVHIVESR